MKRSLRILCLVIAIALLPLQVILCGNNRRRRGAFIRIVL